MIDRRRHARVALTDGELNVLARLGEPVDVRRGPEVVVGRTVELLSQLRAEAGLASLAGMGVALPGPVAVREGAPVPRPPCRAGTASRYGTRSPPS